MKTTLPQPTAEALAHSECLQQKIAAAISNNSGAIAFDHYMQMALYEPGLGYYSAGAQKFGAAGDFVTAPEISPLFSQCLARQCQQILAHVNNGSILEFGAGSGIMARDILLALSAHNALPEQYYILEVSADLKQRQQAMLAQAIPNFFANIIWLDRLPAAFNGVILANEVIDAFPVKLFAIENNELAELWVTLHHGQFQWQKHSTELTQVTEFKQQSLLASHYQSEINLLIAPWINSLSSCLRQGAAILIDYGFPRHEYYHPQRHQGTLMCHYRHHAHANPFFLPGLQDITAHVDFTAIAESAVTANLQVSGYNTQTGFLLGCGLLELIQNQQPLGINQQIHQLTSPAEMGELFKVMALTRNLDITLIGFSQQDLRGRL